MRVPAYLLLPISGAVVLTAAVLGVWLWPAPTVPSPSARRSSPTPPLVVATPEPPPAPMLRPPPPRAHLGSPVSNPGMEAPRTEVAMPAEPGTEPEAPVPPAPLQMTDMTPEARVQLRQRWSSLRERGAELAQRGVEQLERQREEARARGDQAEVDRLDAIIRDQRDRLEKMRTRRVELAPVEQGGPPVE